MDVSGQLHALPFYPGERAPSTHWIVGRVGPQSQSGRCGQEKCLALPGIEPGHSSPSLHRLGYADSNAFHTADGINLGGFTIERNAEFPNMNFDFVTCN
jgi:hypothetical protein